MYNKKIIQVNAVAQVPPRAIRMQCQQKNMYSTCNHTDRDHISGSDAEKRLTMIASMVQGLHPRLMPLFTNHHTSSLANQPCCKHLNQCKRTFTAWCSKLNNEKTLQQWGNASSSRHKVASWTHPHPEKKCIISLWLILSPPCGPISMNHINCLLTTLNRCHQNSNYIAPTIMCIVETTKIPIVITEVCEVGKSLKTPSNLIL